MAPQKKTPPQGGGPGNKMKFGKPKNTGKTIKRMLSYVAKSKGLLAIVILMVIISAGANVAGTYLLSPIVDELGVMLSTGSRDMSNVMGYLVVLAGIYVLGVAAQYGQSIIILISLLKTIIILRNDCFDHLQDLLINFFDPHNYVELMRCYTNDVDTVR